MHDPWTKAIDLQNWATKSVARTTLPWVIRRLIWATAKPTNEFSFPAGEGVQRPSWDGRLTVEQGNVWVPAQSSFWEISVGRPPASKADENYDKRTADTPPEVAAERAFVFVTPLKWTEKLAWAEARRVERKWRDVRVLDSDDLEHWLEIAPAVDIWLARLIGKRPQGVRDLSNHWERIAALTQPTLPAEAFLAGRETAREELLKALAGEPAEVLVSASSEQELIDFVAAAFGASMEGELSARFVIVENSDSWDSLASSSHPLVLMPSPGFAVSRTEVALAIKGSHHVLCRRPYSAQPQAGVIRLSRAWRFEMAAALKKAGFVEERAERLSRECGGYLDVLQRLAVPNSGSAAPLWARDADGASMLPFTLIGSWDHSTASDRDVVAQITGQSYEKTSEFAAGWLPRPESPFRRTGSQWQLTSREDAWIHLAPRLTPAHLEQFTTVALAVLSEDDPSFEMKPDERMFAAIHGKVLSHSGRLREGIAETLALLGSGLMPLPALPGSDGTPFAAKVVRVLLSNARTTHRWFTLSPILPLLAEAAPDEFMEAVERDLGLESPTLLGLLTEDDNGMFGGNRHCSLMWALNSLAWHPPYLTRSALALARLADLDPGGRMNPRPEGSLYDIFRPWFPQTAASPFQRFEVVDLLIARAPQMAWKLLKAMLPQDHGFAMHTSSPRWREWPTIKSPKVTGREQYDQWDWTGDRLARMAGTDNQRLRELIREVDHLLDKHFELLVLHLSNLDVQQLSKEDCLNLWNELRELIRKHEFHNTAKWRMEEQRLFKLRQVEPRLRPEAPFDYGRWLFERHHLNLGTHSETSIDEQDAMALEHRKALVLELYEDGGVKAVADFATTLPFPGLVGDALAKALPDRLPEEVLPRYLSDDAPNTAVFGKYFASAVFHTRGWCWVESLELAQWSVSAAKEFLLILPEDSRTWELAKSLGKDVEDAYWRTVLPYPRNKSAEEATTAVRHLLDYNRPLVAAEYIGFVYHNRMTMPASLMMETLEKSLPALNEAARGKLDISHVIYELGELLGFLQEAPDNAPLQVAHLEWACLPLMRNGHASPKFLQQELGRNPSLFVQCIELIFRKSGEPEDDSIDREDMAAKARLAHELLDSWHTHPALNEDGGPNSVALHDWIDAVRQGCTKSQRADAGDYQIGKLLASSPAEADGS